MFFGKTRRIIRRQNMERSLPKKKKKNIQISLHLKGVVRKNAVEEVR